MDEPLGSGFATQGKRTTIAFLFLLGLVAALYLAYSSIAQPEVVFASSGPNAGSWAYPVVVTIPTWFGALWSWRMRLYVGDAGFRFEKLTGTTEVPWGRVQNIDMRRQITGRGSGGGTTVLVTTRGTDGRERVIKIGGIVNLTANGEEIWARMSHHLPRVRPAA